MAALVGGLAALLVTSCSLTGVDRERVIATISGFEDGDPQIRLTQSGNSVEVEVDSYGAGCYEKGETEVEVDQENLIATITPYDYIPSDCNHRDLGIFNHSATVNFVRTGTAQIRVRGLHFGSRGEDTLIVETREVELGQ